MRLTLALDAAGRDALHTRCRADLQPSIGVQTNLPNADRMFAACTCSPYPDNPLRRSFVLRGPRRPNGSVERARRNGGTSNEIYKSVR